MIRHLLIVCYIWLVRHNACPCVLAGRAQHALDHLYVLLSRALAAFGRLCARLDGLIVPADGLCLAGCPECGKAEEAA